jgi:predicted GNAT family acetyltransferase
MAGFPDVNVWLESVKFRELDGMATGSVRDNKAQSRFELDVEGGLAFANYRLTPSAVIITHTETPRSLRGRGIASELVRGALHLIRADGLKVVAGCGFVVDYLRRHPEFSDLVG